MLVNVKLQRVDYAQVGTTSRGCMRIIHADKSGSSTPKKKSGGQSKYRIVVGANSGVLLSLERKTDETKIIFKTNPGPPITFVRLGGALQTIQDKIFAASGETVRGYSKKGKQFLSFESNMAEMISAMYVYGVDLFLAGRNTVYQYHDCVEKANFMCTDKITDIICLSTIGGGWVGRGVTPLVACEDKTIKVLQNLQLQYEVILGDIPSTMHLFMNDGGFTKQKVLYGTRNGRLGLLDLGEKSGGILWEMATSSAAAITAIYCHKLTENTYPDIVIGKDDGVIDIYTVNENDFASYQQSYNCNESITSLECIHVDEGNYDEIIVSTYTGWVFGLSTEHYNAKTSKDKKISTDNTPSLQVKVQKMQSELDQLELKVKEEREKYHDMIMKGAEDNKEGPFVDTTPPFHVNDRFTLNKYLACYTLTLELAVPIEYVFLHSDVDVELMDVEKNSAVISVTEKDPAKGNQLLAVYRCQADITRMEMRIRSIEGQCGTLKTYIVPRLQIKTCQLRFYPIKPLALHERVHHFDETRPLSVLTATGSFSINEAHSWLLTSISQVPERCPGTDTVTLNFQSTFNGGTMLQATYSKGQAVFRSDNISTIFIMRDVISRQTTQKQMKIHLSCDFNDASVEHALRLIHPKMEYQAQLAKKYELATSLKELKAAFGDVSYLNAELTNILNNHDKLYEEADDKQIYFDRIVGIIVDLFIDRAKVNGVSASHKGNDLVNLLNEDYSLQNVLNFFETYSK